MSPPDAGALGACVVVHGGPRTGKSELVVARAVALSSALAASPGSVSVVAPTSARARLLHAELARALDGPAQPPSDHDGVASRPAVRVGTLDGLVTPLLRAHAEALGLEEDFRVLGRAETDALVSHTVDAWSAETLRAPGPGLSRWLRRQARARGDSDTLLPLRAAARRRIATRAWGGSLRPPSIDRAAEIAGIVEALGALADLASHGPPDSWLTKSLEHVARVHASLRDTLAEPAERGPDWDRCEAAIAQLAEERLWGWSGSGLWFARSLDLTREAVIARRAAAHARVRSGLARLDAVLAAELHAELDACVRRYELELRRSGALDELDVVRHACRLLTDRSASARLAGDLPLHLLIDDHDALPHAHVELATHLAAAVRAADGTLLVTTDPARERALGQPGAHTQVAGAELVELPSRHRGRTDLALLAAELRCADGRDARGDAEREALGTRDAAARPSLVALAIPRPYSEHGRVSATAIEESTPQAIAAFIAWLPGSGWTVRERGADGESVEVPVALHHVAVLFPPRRPDGVDAMGAVARALGERDVPCVVGDGASLFGTEVGQALRAALAVCAWPDDELAMYALLRGPFLGLDDELLFAYRHSAGALALWAERRVDLDATLQPVADALGLVRELVDSATREGAATALRRFLTATRAHAQVTMWSTGAAAAGHLDDVLDWLDHTAAVDHPSPRALLARIDQGRAAAHATPDEWLGRRDRGPLLASLAEIRARGFPVVILADPTASRVDVAAPHRVDASRATWAEPVCGLAPEELSSGGEPLEAVVDRHLELALYDAVACARDLLVVPYCGDGPMGGWLDQLGPLFEPRAPRAPDDAPGCPPFAHDSVLERPARARRPASGSIRPGLHRAKAGRHSIVFWDPAALPPPPSPDAPLRNAQLLVAREGDAAREATRAFEAWHARQARLRAAGGEPAHPEPARAHEGDAEPSPPLERVDVELPPDTPLHATIRAACAAAASLRTPDLAPRPQAASAATRADHDAIASLCRAIATGATGSGHRARFAQRSPMFRCGDGVLRSIDVAFADSDGGYTLVSVSPAAEAREAEALLLRCSEAALRSGAPRIATRLVVVTSRAG